MCLRFGMQYCVCVWALLPSPDFSSQSRSAGMESDPEVPIVSRSCAVDFFSPLSSRVMLESKRDYESQSPVFHHTMPGETYY